MVRTTFATGNPLRGFEQGGPISEKDMKIFDPGSGPSLRLQKEVPCHGLDRSNFPTNLAGFAGLLELILAEGFSHG
jgi:hypothetical protein